MKKVWLFVNLFVPALLVLFVIATGIRLGLSNPEHRETTLKILMIFGLLMASGLVGFIAVYLKIRYGMKIQE